MAACLNIHASPSLENSFATCPQAILWCGWPLCPCILFCKIRGETGSQSTALGRWMLSNIRQNCVNVPSVIPSYLLPLQRASSSLLPFSGKIFSDSSSKTPVPVKDQLFRHRTNVSSVWHKVAAKRSFNIFLSLSAMDGCLTAPTSSTLSQFVR